MSKYQQAVEKRSDLEAQQVKLNERVQEIRRNQTTLSARLFDAVERTRNAVAMEMRGKNTREEVDRLRQEENELRQEQECAEEKLREADKFAHKMVLELQAAAADVAHARMAITTQAIDNIMLNGKVREALLDLSVANALSNGMADPNLSVSFWKQTIMGLLDSSLWPSPDEFSVALSSFQKKHKLA